MAGGLVLLFAVACSPEAGPVPPAPPAPAADHRFGAPSIDAPRDLSSRSSAPCTDLLDATQLRRLRYDPQGRQRLVIGMAPACKWSGSAPRRTLDAVVWVGRDYFVDAYRSRLFEIFQPTTIAGLPAVRQQTTAGRSSCTFTVGVADRQALDVTANVEDVDAGGEPLADPCAEGRQVVEAIVATLPPKQGR